ncbi:MAG: hypothetical protein JO040_10135 [Gemmatimonadetes bacterium]|nr:hypothetical protein [Gemmatimonadota bacterium]
MSNNPGPGPSGPTERAGEPGQPGMRKEVGDAASSQKHPPHVAGHLEDAPVQGSSPSPAPIPTLGANAHGSDKSEITKQPGIREESMYENRPAENKNSPPSTTGGQ